MAVDLVPILSDIQNGKIAAAAASCKILLQRYPNDAGLHQMAAVIALAEHQPHSAAQHAAKALSLRPDHPPTLLLAGKAARKLGDGAMALNLFRRCATLMPDRSEPVFLTCAVLLEQENPEARLLLDRALQHFPEDGPGWAEIGQVLHKAGKFEAALVALERAAKTAPSAALATLQAATLHGLAEALRQSGALEEARRRLEAAIALRPEARVLFTLGLTCQDLGDLMAAEAAFRRALEVDPTLAEAAVNQGIVLQDMGRLDEAKQAYGAALRIRPDTFGRIAQAITTAPRGELWLDLAALRQALVG